ncbi:MAG: MFS transporter [Novosphingobium sp.]
MTAGPAVNATFATFLLPIATEFGWPRAQVTAGLTIVSVVGVLGYSLTGRLADRFGERGVLILGNLLFAAAIAMLSALQPNVMLYYALFIVLGITATLPSSVIVSKVVATWFDRHRGMVLGITAGCGISVGYMLMPRVSQFFIDTIGWRSTFLVLAGMVLVIGQAAFWYLRTGPIGICETDSSGTEAEVEGMTFAEALRTKTFWLLLITSSCTTGAFGAFAVNLVAYASDRGLDPLIAVWSLMVGAVTNGIWQVVMGRFLDSTRSPRIAAPMVLSSTFGLALIMTSSEPWAWLVGGFLKGVSTGAEYGMAPYAVARYFGRRAYGQIFGFIFGITMLNMGFLPFLASLVFDLTGSYDPAFIAVGCTMLVCGTVILFMPNYDRVRPTAVARPATGLAGSQA